jgi:hypothetical protein
VAVELKADPKNTTQWPLEARLRREGTLVIDYSNGEQQRVELVGWLYRPSLLIEMPNHSPYSPENNLIDFEVVHVNNHKKRSVYLSNPSKSAVDWSI